MEHSSDFPGLTAKPVHRRVTRTFLTLIMLPLAACSTSTGVRTPDTAGGAAVMEAPDGVRTDSVTFIRVNQLGYVPGAPKVAVACSLAPVELSAFHVIDAAGETVYGPVRAEQGGAFASCTTAYRLDFTALEEPGRYRVVAGDLASRWFDVDANVYAGAADTLLYYMRQQRSLFNPLFRDSVHQHTDGILVDHERAGEFIPVAGGWADAADYLQYVTTSAHATVMMLLAHRDHADAFDDLFDAAGLPGSNGVTDVLDEGGWGLEWLVKMYPEDDLLLNQLADDRDHLTAVNAEIGVLQHVQRGAIPTHVRLVQLLRRDGGNHLLSISRRFVRGHRGAFDRCDASEGDVSPALDQILDVRPR